jgi:hypothetical protein
MVLCMLDNDISYGVIYVSDASEPSKQRASWETYSSYGHSSLIVF